MADRGSNGGVSGPNTSAMTWEQRDVMASREDCWKILEPAPRV